MPWGTRWPPSTRRPGWLSALPRRPPPSAPPWQPGWGRTASMSTPPGGRWTEIGSSFGRSTATQRSTGSVPTSWRTGSTAAPPSYSWMTSSPPGGPSSTWSSSCGSGIPGWASGGWQRRPSSAGSLRRTRPGWQRPALPVECLVRLEHQTMSGWWPDPVRRLPCRGPCRTCGRCTAGMEPLCGPTAVVASAAIRTAAAPPWKSCCPASGRSCRTRAPCWCWGPKSACILP